MIYCKKQMQCISKKWIMLTLFGLLLLFNSCSPMDKLLKSKETHYEQEVVYHGNRQTFKQGSILRLPGHPPQLNLVGDHYQMGLQYGVLLQPEILEIRESGRKILKMLVDERGMPEWLTLYILKRKANGIYRRLPQRYQEEMQGIADGSGLPMETIKLFALFSKISEFDENFKEDCTTVVVKTFEDEMIHAWNNDESNGQLSSDYTVIIHYQPEGYNSFIDIKSVFALGSAAAHHPNGSGLSISDNALLTRGSEKGIHPDYYNRMIMEECSSLEDVRSFLDTHVRMIPSALNVTDRDQGQAASFEMAVDHGKMIWRENPLRNDMLWVINKCQNQEISSRYEDLFVTDSPYNNHRQGVLEEFTARESHGRTLNEVVELMRSTRTLSGDDQTGALENAICNAWTVKMVIHGEDGTYLALNNGYFGALGPVYFYPDNREEQPALLYDEVSLLPLHRDFGEIVSSIHTRAESNAAYEFLVEKYPQEALILFHAAKEAEEDEMYKRLLQQAYHLDGSHYQIAIEYAASIMTEELDKSIIILEEMDAEEIESMDLYYASYRLVLLTEAYNRKGETDFSNQYWNKLEELRIHEKHIENMMVFAGEL